MSPPLGTATVNVEIVVDPWSMLTMRVRAANLEAAAELERAICKWGDHLYGNWLGHLLHWPANPLFPLLSPTPFLPFEIPHSPWTLDALFTPFMPARPGSPWLAADEHHEFTTDELRKAVDQDVADRVRAWHTSSAFAEPTDRVDAVPAAEVRSSGRGWRSGLLSWSALRILPRLPQFPRW
jgi:hypothetical protein